MNVQQVRNVLDVAGAKLRKIFIDSEDEYQKIECSAGNLLNVKLKFKDWQVANIEGQLITVYPITPQGYMDYIEAYQRKFSSSRVEALIALQSVMRNLATEDKLIEFRNSLFSLKDDLFEGINPRKIESELSKVGCLLDKDEFDWYDENYHIKFRPISGENIDSESFFDELNFRHWRVSKVYGDSVIIYPIDSKGYMEYIEYYRLQFRTSRQIAFIALQRIVAENGTVEEEEALDRFFHGLKQSMYLVCQD